MFLLKAREPNGKSVASVTSIGLVPRRDTTNSMDVLVIRESSQIAILATA